MTRTAQLLTKKALSLPPVDRALMIEELIASFDPAERRRVDRAWAREAEARIREFERGKAKARPLGDFIGHVQSESSHSRKG